MRRSLGRALCLLTIAGFSFPALAETGDGSSSRARDASWNWQTSLAAGLDAYSHTYSLATTDTTESLLESLLTAAVTGRSSHRARHGGSLTAEASVGSELFRQRLEGEYRFKDGSRRTRWRLDGRLRGRQYRSGTDYENSSDNTEGQLRLRARPWVSDRRFLETSGSLAFLEYADPSTLEVSHRTAGLGLACGNEGWRGPTWRLGTALDGRSYPDSTRIDRRRIILDGQFSLQGEQQRQLLVMHRSERRHIRDATAKPSGWLHWTDLAGQMDAGTGWVFLELQSEHWDYDREQSAYLDSWRVKTVTGYSWGDALAASWKVGLALERLWSTDAPEAFTAAGLVAGVETYNGPVSGSLSLEVGRREYTADEGEWGQPTGSTYDEDLDAGVASGSLYSDFTYWEIWLMGEWRLNRRFSLEVQASYAPESHTEDEDDTALGFATMRLVFRP